MKRFIFFAYSLFMVCFCAAQEPSSYHLSRRLFTYNYPASEDVFRKYTFSGYDKYMHIYLKPSNDTTLKILLTKLDLTTGAVIEKDSFTAPEDMYFSDALATPKFDLLLGSGRVLFYNKSEGVHYLKKVSDTIINFSEARLLNDSLALLYTIYNFHPADGPIGLHLNLYNTHTHEIIKSKSYHYPGIALSAMAANWVLVNKSLIYVFTPLSGKYFVYDAQLEPVRTGYLPQFNKLTEENSSYEKKLDSLEYGEYNRVKAIINKYGIDSIHKNRALIESNIVGKQFLSELLHDTRAKYAYIEHVFNVAEDTIAISVAKPEYERKYRDLYIIDLKSEKTILFQKWLANRADSCNKIEDYFPLNLGNSPFCELYFYKNKVYGSAINDIDLYENGTKDAIDKKIYQSTLKNGYKWSILEYDY